MNTTGRPKPVQAWMKAHTKTAVPPIDFSLYPAQTLAWWKVNQPGWRTAGVDTVNPAAFKREPPSDPDWSTLPRGGTAGIYTVVMALSWWVANAGATWSEELVAVVDDLSWVLQQMCQLDCMKETTPPRAAKRVREEDGQPSVDTKTSSGRQVKRYVRAARCIDFRTIAQFIVSPALVVLPTDRNLCSRSCNSIPPRSIPSVCVMVA
jgi:hypothetical protein